MVKIGEVEIEIVKGDITSLDVDAIVNPANNYLMHGGGLTLAIIKRGGQVIQQESKKFGNVPTGGAVITSGGKLKAKHVIHAVGPRYKDGKSGESEKLASAVKASLTIAVQKKLTSIALPAISSGTFGYPIEESSKIIIDSVKEFIEKADKEKMTLKKVIICLFDDKAYEVFKKYGDKVVK